MYSILVGNFSKIVVGFFTMNIKMGIFKQLNARFQFVHVRQYKLKRMLAIPDTNHGNGIVILVRVFVLKETFVYVIITFYFIFHMTNIQ